MVLVAVDEKRTSFHIKIYKKYIEALKKEITLRLQDGAKIKTLYFGGGTPSILSLEIMKDLFSFLYKKYDFSGCVEICIECHPSTLSEEKVKGYQEIGITRLSIGVQTFLKKFETFLSRPGDDIFRALEVVKKHFHGDVSLDMIFGYPNQTEKDAQEDLEKLLSYDFSHVSYYALDYKKNSLIEKQEASRLPFEKVQRFYNNIFSAMKNQGWNQYEIYNFSKQNKKSLHNLAFWKGEDYMGFGLSSVSCVGREVCENTKNIMHYIEGKYSDDIYTMNNADYTELMIQRFFRLREGVSMAVLKDLLSENNFMQLYENIKTIPSWVEEKDNTFVLTEEGVMNYDEVMGVIVL